MSQSIAAGVRLTQTETDHAARIVEALRATGGLSYPQIARRLGYASHSQLVRLVKHRKRISRARYDTLVRWSNGEPPTMPQQNAGAPTPVRPRVQEEKTASVSAPTSSLGEVRKSGAAGTDTSSRWERWALRLRALPAVVSQTIRRVA